ncbi:hypothetical protein [Cardinium endosymbiont of Philonthus spinipes]|uniref:hypothetical protein n=1 Tax=Cardinium endosymbiont of Philonthus spinipes TaxID=3077941 RepID=UPI00313DF1D7
MKNSWLFSPNGKGMALSIALHLFALGLTYCIKRTPAPAASSAQSYRIALEPAITHTIAEHHLPNHTTGPSLQAAHLATTQPEQPANHQRKHQYTRPKQQHQKQPGGLRRPQKLKQPRKVAKIDERGLYNKGKNHAKQTDATLELRGWEWDAVPRPNDTTEEWGKIVFEIKVDKEGEIISILTIEKTVTPMVEKIYADALRALTFSKTADAPAGIATGKVTFVLIAK